MSMSVTFRGGETAGSVSDRQIETAKQETTGGVGARKRQDSIFLTDEPKCDTVCFKSQGYSENEPKKGVSTVGILLGLVGTTALAVGLLGLTHKNNWLNNIKNPKVKDVLKNADKVTEPCYNFCKWIKNHSYDKIVEFVKSKK